MSHPNDNTLLLLAYGELPITQATELESHVAGCETCRAVFAPLVRARAALDEASLSTSGRRSRLDWTAVALAAAALLAVVLMTGPRPNSETTTHWTPATTWSRTAGYMTGGRAMMEIDAQLTQLERGWRGSYGRP
ncbi:MAG TPA: hypothetical protein VH439_13175 [Gemmatimonadales bacterium]|jgi:anti-sigma factor RsiW